MGYQPLHKHDCLQCMFLGTMPTERSAKKQADLYFCPQAGDPTVIARYSDVGEDYSSGLEFSERNVLLKEAKARAVRLGFLPG